ncbi:mitochondrial coenzyme A diphosphatase NUDT8 isoform X2 [Anastrepha obliqua]|uniref:mitochondrial coenzyme A diphosphatase NUDT8 isoform X2 n=1 Tax=Anastrepha obliqua TaxID=95512 RepID=UPI00240A54FC|nr:mitochondrial coenzyme A diphosphatase NUDT8 isoform X2 [Anastrepha obliqua]
MLSTKTLRFIPFQFIRRRLILYTAKRAGVCNHNDEESCDIDKYLETGFLLSEKNKLRAMQCMRTPPPIGLRLGKTTNETSFAAVLICLCTDERDEVSILYTRRSSRLSRHSRQISFPGGIMDPDDADFIDCALREAEEEIGLSRRRIHVWGSELKLNEDEVEEALLMPLKELVHPKTLRHTQFRGGWSTPNFVIGHNKVWGITGFITNTFLQCLIPIDLKRLKHHAKYIRPFKIKK